MKKNFDKWNNEKKFLDNKKSNFNFDEREIWWIAFGENVGEEISGKGDKFIRPGIVYKKMSSQNSFVLPISSTVREGNFYCNLFLNGKNRSILLHQGRFVSKKRFLRRIETISENKFKEIKKGFEKLFKNKIEKPDFSGFSRAPYGEDNIIISNKEFKSSNYKKRLEKLNEKQREAVDQIDGPVLVVAGPGTGKTELLSLRVGNILEKTDTAAQNILLLTFTDSASENMRERLLKLIGETAYRVNIFTFHSFASFVISQYSEYFFSGAKFRPATPADQVFIIEEILESLKADDILSTYHPAEGFVYSKDILGRIKDLKRGNLEPEDLQNKIKQNIKEYKQINNFLDNFLAIEGKQTFESKLSFYIDLLKNLEKIKTENNVAKILFSHLELAINEAGELKKIGPLTEFKDEYLQKEIKGYTLKDSDENRIDKLLSLANIYKLYKEKMYEKALYDFDDMIMLCIKAIKENENLKYDLQEKYQYIMVDEFQDTNDAQFELIKSFTKDQEKPNVLVVGDDDQAIYKFQGAELSNIFNFVNTYKNTKIVVLDKNYRSTQKVLDFSRKIILKAKDRLEVRDKNINKNLIASNLDLIERVGIVEKSFENEYFEMDYICKEIKKLSNYSEIAIISRKHKTLGLMAKLLEIYKIPFSYERKENVLEIKPVKEIITILKYLYFINFEAEKAESLLPEILSFSFLKIDRIEIWKISEKVKRGIEEIDEFGKRNSRKITWLEVMENSDNEKIKNFHNWIINLSFEAKTLPLEYIIDLILNSSIKEYYFTENKNIEYLLAIKTFVGAVAEFHNDKTIYIQDILEFLKVYDVENGIILTNENPFFINESSENKVALMTAHKAKGMEFEYVFLLDSNDSTWKRAGLSNKISLPLNMKISSDLDDDDDKIRLLYVALTRAKHSLYITHSGKKLEYLMESDITNSQSEFATENKIEISKEILQLLEPEKDSLKIDEKEFLKNLINNYKMPFTHLQHFLNFTTHGPSKFIEQDLLKFPQKRNVYAAYGIAMHEVAEIFYKYKSASGKSPTEKFVQERFIKALERQRLSKKDFEKYLKVGEKNVRIFYKFLKERVYLKDTKTEVSFYNENIKIENAQIYGNIDMIEKVSKEEIILTDFKTGDYFESWEDVNNEGHKIKLHFFKYQLAFYSLLLKNSVNYKDFKVKVGQIIFAEADKKKNIHTLELIIDEKLLDRVKKLINIVYNKIINLDFPDVTKYEKKATLKSILEFEDDLINNKI